MYELGCGERGCIVDVVGLKEVIRLLLGCLGRVCMNCVKEREGVLLM